MPALPADAAALARMIDHTLLAPAATPAQIERCCAEVAEHGMASVCVHPLWVALAAMRLAGSVSGVCTVIGFPLGANLAATKAEETRRAVSEGASEVDMVISLGLLRAGLDARVEAEIAGVVEAAGGARVKVILETGLLEGDELERACDRAAAAGAHFVKTSTGFGARGASVEDVRRMTARVGDRLGVKASGGIRDAGAARAMIEAGATRLGTSASLAILTDWEQPSP